MIEGTDLLQTTLSFFIIMGSLLLVQYCNFSLYVSDEYFYLDFLYSAQSTYNADDTVWNYEAMKLFNLQHQEILILPSIISKYIIECIQKSL